MNDFNIIDPLIDIEEYESLDDAFANDWSFESIYSDKLLDESTPTPTMPLPISDVSIDETDKAFSVSVKVGAVTENDIVCGRSSLAHSHPGNKRFRDIVRRYKDQYQNAMFREQKGRLVTNLMDLLEQNGSRFLKISDKRAHLWEPLNHEQVYEKVSHALRSAKTSRSKQSKKENAAISAASLDINAMTFLNMPRPQWMSRDRVVSFAADEVSADSR